MNEYLLTTLGEEHRRELLAEAYSNGLAREAAVGRETWWHRVSGRAAHWAADHRRQRHGALQPAEHQPAH
jgi:hypothetical protein